MDKFCRFNGATCEAVGGSFAVLSQLITASGRTCLGQLACSSGFGFLLGAERLRREVIHLLHATHDGQSAHVAGHGPWEYFYKLAERIFALRTAVRGGIAEGNSAFG